MSKPKTIFMYKRVSFTHYVIWNVQERVTQTVLGVIFRSSGASGEYVFKPYSGVQFTYKQLLEIVQKLDDCEKQVRLRKHTKHDN